MPRMTVFRPADGNEVAAAYELAIRDSRHPSLLALSRQNLPHLDSSREKAKRGAYQVFDTAGVGSGGKPDLVIVATGSEVSIAIEGAKQLSQEGKRTCVVSLLSWEIFEQQDREYR
jgi:transketolase